VARAISSWRTPRKHWQNPSKIFGDRRAFIPRQNLKEVVMKEADVNQYRMLLMAKREEVACKLPRREELWIVQSNEQIETVQLAGQREFAARTLEREARSLAQIAAALQRIDDGEFGICLDCEGPISEKRLAAVPWAGYCLRCQKMRDAEDAPNRFEALAA
jgi:RNA polymerase-binding transcription factor